MSAITASYHDFVDTILRSFDAMVLARGRQYAAERRVQLEDMATDHVRAVVTGTQRYVVELASGAGQLRFACTCKAYEREGECKHIAALAYTMRGPAKPASSTPEPEHEPPQVLRHVRSASALFLWLGIDVGRSAGVLQSYATLYDWWYWTKRKAGGGSSAAEAACAELLALAPALERELAELRTFEVPRVDDDGTAYAELQRALADMHDARKARATIVGFPPWSVASLRKAEREPRRMRFELDASRGLLRVREAAENPRISEQVLGIELTTPSRSVPEIRGDNVTNDPLADAWRILALRELCIAMSARTDPALETLAGRLGAPSWEATLAHVERQREADLAPRQWMFTVAEAYGQAIEVTALARKVAKSGKLARPVRTPLTTLFEDEQATGVERRLATLLLAAGVHSGKSRFELGTPQAHEILRLLSQHPRVMFLGRDGDRDDERERDARDDDEQEEGEEIAERPVAESDRRFVVEDLVVRLTESGRDDGSLVPRFFAGDRELDPRMLDAAKGSFVGTVTRDGVLSIAIPKGARPWIAAAAARPKGFVFPKQATSRLVAALRPLVAAGHAEVPTNALGAELTLDVQPGVRVLWGPGAYASVEVLVRPHPAAPLVAAGMGAEVFTFEHDGAPVFVMRDLRRERIVAERLANALDEIAEPLAWSENVGTTEDAASTIALGGWLEANPLGIAIEVKRGAPPTIVPMTTVGGDIRVSRQGAWLVLGGALDLHGTKITFGEVLEAARRARKYVEARPGVFLELSEETSSKLAMLAAATELAGSMPGELRIHHGLRAAIEGAKIALPEVRGLDVPELAQRLERAHREKASGKRRKGAPVVDALLEHGKLRAYQAEAVRWMLDLTSWAPGCILADDMGLGKTVQTAAVLRARAKDGPQLILAPASVASNWMAELKRFVPSLRARFFNEEVSTELGEVGPGDVVVASYGILLRRKAALKEAKWTSVVVDEAQYVKNTTAQRTEAVRSLDRDFTIALTGTPVENHLGELFSVIDAAVPGLLGNEMIFRELFRRPIEGKGDSGRLGLLTRMIGPFVLRRTRASVLDDLPEREEITEYVDLSAAERKHYLALRKACERTLAKRKRGETDAQLKIAILAALLRLRQLACDVRLVDDSFQGESTKIERIVELATQVAEEGSRAIVFSQFAQFLEKIRAALVAAGLKVASLTGETPTTKRRALIDAFQRGEHDVFCVSLMAGGTGLNLTAASYVIHADPWWNPAVEEQATSRAHRMGQSSKVTVYRLVARGTIEEAVLAMHAAKRGLAEAVLAGQGEATAITPAELMELLRFGGV
ncbi:MAG: DEAD/DEAH box helicase [Deltaproteobacteria bacterium]|nr:DEAD/DEAH box helicase [Deltaproteobacteria bacterium]